MSSVQPFDTQETATRLRESLSTIEWAVSVVPERWSHDLPDFYTQGEWGVAMNLAHLVVYEERIALPVLEALAAGGDGADATPSGGEDWFLNDAVALSKEEVGVMVERLRKARVRQIEIVETYDAQLFNAPVTPLWSSGRHGAVPHSAGWVATKTFQHTWEHGNAILRLVLFAPG